MPRLGVKESKEEEEEEAEEEEEGEVSSSTSSEVRGWGGRSHNFRICFNEVHYMDIIIN